MEGYCCFFILFFLFLFLFFIYFFFAAVSTRAWESNHILYTVRIKTAEYSTSTNRIVIRVKLSIDRTVRRVAVISTGTSRFVSVGLHTIAPVHA